jgi:hypothetical protein
VSNLENDEAKEEYEAECLEVVLSSNKLSDKVFYTIFEEKPPEELIGLLGDLTPYMSVEDAVEVIETTDGGIDNLTLANVNVNEITRMITFENSNNIAHNISMSNPLVATALLEELLVYRKDGRI